jgi:hypothetical protein
MMSLKCQDCGTEARYALIGLGIIPFSRNLCTYCLKNAAYGIEDGTYD